MTVENKTPKDLILLANLMDTKFTGPFGFKFGLDGIIGLLPVFGDASTAVVSLYIIIRAYMMNAPLSVLIHMFLNVLFEFLIGLIPILGDAFDFFWKANTKNLSILSKWLEKPQRTKRNSFLKTAGFLICVISFIGITIYLLVSLLILALGVATSI